MTNMGRRCCQGAGGVNSEGRGVDSNGRGVGSKGKVLMMRCHSATGIGLWAAPWPPNQDALAHRPIAPHAVQGLTVSGSCDPGGPEGSGLRGARAWLQRMCCASRCTRCPTYSEGRRSES